MAKGQDAKRKDKKEPLKTAKEKKRLKERKNLNTNSFNSIQFELNCV
jgi:hypothetical protein